ncbi:MAG: hypothetical protein ACLFS5_01840 [Spirochaetaceae bacterium]
MGWKSEARRTIVGPTHYLKTLPYADTKELHYWFRPRKWSIEAADTIRAKEHELRKALGKEGLSLITHRKDILEKIQDAHKRGENVTEADIIHLLSEEELAALITGTTPQDQAELIKLQLLHGVHDHNLDDEDGKVIEISESEVGDFLEFPDVAGEMVEVIREWNRPLARRRSDNSETSLNGDSTGDSLSPTDPTSPTDQTPTSS